MSLLLLIPYFSNMFSFFSCFARKKIHPLWEWMIISFLLDLCLKKLQSKINSCYKEKSLICLCTVWELRTVFADQHICVWTRMIDLEPQFSKHYFPITNWTVFTKIQLYLPVIDWILSTKVLGYFEVLISSIPKWDLIWKQGCCRCH